MEFEMDQQSFDDLAIFGYSSDTYSVFEKYSRTRTVGGRNLMAEMMSRPSNKLELLRSRRDSIEFFMKSELKLEITFESCDLILHYLAHGGVLLKDNLIDSFKTRLKDIITPSQDYYNICVGLKRLLPLLKHAEEISEVLVNSGVEHLGNLGAKMKAITALKDFQFAISLSGSKKLNFDQVATLDVIVRKRYLEEINDVLQVLYELDVFETLSAVCATNGYCLPSYFEEHASIKWKATGLYHPAIASPVTTGMSIDQENNLFFLSGSNMSGKSSFLKSIGLAVYLSHLGFPVPAKELKTTVFNGLLTTINLPDNVTNGLSHYYSEVMRIKKIAGLLNEQKKLFVLLDELFKGTNSRDAYEASLLVLNGFAEIKNSVFIVSSHITELAPQLKQENINLVYLEHKIQNEKPIFTYELRKGIAIEGVGMYFINSENIKSLLEKAKYLI